MPVLLPWRNHPLRLFAVSLLALVSGLALLLFGVKLEALAPATGILTSRDAVEVRARRAGLIEVCHRAGDELAGGAVFARLVPFDSTAEEPFAAPPAGCWLITEVPVASGQAVQPGDVIARLVPIGGDHRMLQPVAQLDVDERQFGQLEVGQPVRLAVAMYDHRLHGYALARLERLGPAVIALPDGRRVVRAWAAVESAPFPLRPGASVQAEIVTGKKATYQIILEH